MAEMIEVIDEEGVNAKSYTILLGQVGLKLKIEVWIDFGKSYPQFVSDEENMIETN